MHLRAAQARIAISDHIAARELLRKGVAIMTDLAQGQPDNPHYIYNIAGFKVHLGDVAENAGEAVAEWRGAAKMLRSLVELDKNNAEWRNAFTAVASRLADLETRSSVQVPSGDGNESITTKGGHPSHSNKPKATGWFNRAISRLKGR